MKFLALPLTLAVAFGGCGTDTPPEPAPADTLGTETGDIHFFDSAEDVIRVDVPGDSVDESDVSAAAPDVAPDANDCGMLGCSCESDRQCESGLCIPFGLDGLGIQVS